MSDKKNTSVIKNILIAILAIAVITITLLLMLPLEKKNNEIRHYGQNIYDASLSDSRIRYILDNPEEYPDELFDILRWAFTYEESEKEKYIDFVYNYAFHKDDYMSMTFTDDELHSSEVPQLYMSDKRWAYEKIGNDYIFESGCMTVAITMAYLYLTNDKNIDPVEVALMAEQKESMSFLSGINSDSAVAICEEIGLNVYEYNYDPNQGGSGSADFETVKKVLDDRHVLLVGMSGETFGNHAIIIRSYDENGNVYINDPNMKENSEKLWSFDELADEVLYMWDVSKK